MSAPEEPRRGRTQRQLERCIMRAKDGRVVVFVAANLDQAGACMDRCAAMLQAQRIGFNYRKLTRTLDLPGGQIIFRSIDNPKQPLTLRDVVPSPLLRAQATIIYDHHAEYLIDRERRRAEQEAHG